MRRPYLPPKDHLAAIGATAVIWSAIESAMELVILGLYEIDPERGLMLTSNLSFQARLSLLRILANEGAIRDPKLAEEMKAIIPRLDTGSIERNTIVHGLWGPAPGEQRHVVRRLAIRVRGKKLVTDASNYSARELWAVHDRLALLARDLSALMGRLGIDERLLAAPRHSSSMTVSK